MKFLELHYEDGRPGLVNLENVTLICEPAPNAYAHGKTRIYFNGSDEDIVDVKESYIDIVKAINEDF